MIKNFKIFVFHRTLFTSKIKRVVEKIKAQKKEIIFDTDDLVYDPRYLQYMDYYKKMNKMEKKLYENGVGGEILRDSYVKVCTTTTSFLKEKLEKFNKKVFLIQNKLSNADLKFIEEAINLKKIKNDDKIKIGYFSGTISHNKDFASITDALFEVMDENKNVELYLFGPLDAENKLKKFGERIKQFNFVPRKKHYQNISKVDINLLPLELNNPFCESKSELKFFEAGILSVPTIASDTRTNKEAIIDGFDGFLANDQKEWIEKLNFLIKDENLRKTIGENARKKVLEKYVNKSSNNEEYYSYLRNVLLKIK